MKNHAVERGKAPGAFFFPTAILTKPGTYNDPKPPFLICKAPVVIGKGLFPHLAHFQGFSSRVDDSGGSVAGKSDHTDFSSGFKV